MRGSHKEFVFNGIQNHAPLPPLLLMQPGAQKNPPTGSTLHDVHLSADMPNDLCRD
jgi:hypothetical protein